MCPDAAMNEWKVGAALTAWRSRRRWAWFWQAVTTVAVLRSPAGTVVHNAGAVRSGADAGPVTADADVGDRDAAGDQACVRVVVMGEFGQAGLVERPFAKLPARAERMAQQMGRTLLLRPLTANVPALIPGHIHHIRPAAR